MHNDPRYTLSRRAFMTGTAGTLANVAAASLMTEGSLQSHGGADHAPRAKRVIYLDMAGAPPQLDMFDYKPKLVELDRTLCPKEFIEGRRLAFIKGHPKLLAPPHPFVRMGERGHQVTSLMPHFASIIDEVAMVHSMHTDEFNHAQADLFLQTGSNQPGKPSLGSWTTWGLGTENHDLPGFIVLSSGGSDPTGGSSLWSSGFLPSSHQGVRCRAAGDPILYVSNPEGVDADVRRRTLDAVRELNEEELERVGDPEIEARIDQFELAYRMQTTVPELMDISKEPGAVIEEYGAQPGQASFANNCLLARRLSEAGVRFIQLYDWGWDIHGTNAGDDLMDSFPQKCRQIDRPIAALIRDLKQRGLLDETLVIWGGEFGRTSMNEERNGSKKLGRDHHPDAFTIWMAGGGVKPGISYGATDELGYFIDRDPVHVHDLQATILHILGLDPHELRYPYLGLQQRLIGPAEGPRVVHELLS
ncbi:MAG: DUF1501 domain-containing protein [Planctomycetes bacterium]|nr:DUF1501 domain-containing protein [Planctomycetota bacterium]